MMEFVPIAEWRARPIPERTTVDDVVCKVGDVVWCTSHSSLTRRTITRDSLRYWGRYDGVTYSTKRTAVEAALAGASKRLKNAKRDVKRETNSVARFKAMLKDDAS